MQIFTRVAFRSATFERYHLVFSTTWVVSPYLSPGGVSGKVPVNTFHDLSARRTCLLATVNVLQLKDLRAMVDDRRSPTFRDFYMFCFEYAK